MQVRVLSVARDLCPRVSFPCADSLNVDIQPLCATACSNICVQPPASTSVCNRLHQHLCATACINICVQPPASTSVCNRLHQHLCATACINICVQPPASTSVCNRLHQHLCATACINICVHVKNPKCWQSYHWMHENNYDNNNKEEFVQHPSTAQAGSTGHFTVTLTHTHTHTRTYACTHAHTHTMSDSTAVKKTV